MSGGERVAELEALVARPEVTVAELRAQNVELAAARAADRERIAELERLLGEARRSGKWQAAPFSKGDPKPDPDRPGRKTGKAHGRRARHRGHRRTGRPAAVE